MCIWCYSSIPAGVQRPITSTPAFSFAATSSSLVNWSGTSAPHSTPLNPGIVPSYYQQLSGLRKGIIINISPADAAAENRSRKGFSLKRNEIFTASLIAIFLPRLRGVSPVCIDLYMYVCISLTLRMLELVQFLKIVG